MKLSYAIVVFGALLISAELTSALHLHAEWASFKAKFGKSYQTTCEESMRQAIFARNKQYVDKFNQDQSETAGYQLGLSHLSDWTPSELQRLNGLRASEEQQLENSPRDQAFLDKILNDNKTKIPDELDWRTVPGRVTPVKDQGKCQTGCYIC